MRQITKDAIKALYENKNFKRGNTIVVGHLSPITDERSRIMCLHGNPIAKLKEGKLYISHAGWPTNTTKERLNGLPNVHIHQKDFQWYLNGEAWNGYWTLID